MSLWYMNGFKKFWSPEFVFPKKMTIFCLDLPFPHANLRLSQKNFYGNSCWYIFENTSNLIYKKFRILFFSTSLRNTTQMGNSNLLEYINYSGKSYWPIQQLQTKNVSTQIYFTLGNSYFILSCSKSIVWNFWRLTFWLTHQVMISIFPVISEWVF